MTQQGSWWQRLTTGKPDVTPVVDDPHAFAQRAAHTVRRLKVGLSLVSVAGVVAVAFLLGARTEGGAATPPDGAQGVAPTASTTVAPACVSEVESVSRSLRNLDSRLKVGLNVGEYTQLVGDAQVALDSIGAESRACQEALDHFGASIQTHREAALDWEWCIDEYPRCFVDDVGLDEKSEEGGVRIFPLYKAWERAGRETRRGDASLGVLVP